MKTSEEMAQSVMARAKVQRAARKRNIIMAASALLCVCALVISAVTLREQPSDPAVQAQPGPGPQVQTGTDIKLKPMRIFLLADTAAADDIVILENGNKTSGQQQIRVLDIRDMTEDEIQAAYEAEKKYAASVWEQIKDLFSDNSSYFATGPNGMVTIISAGCLHVPIETPSLVESVRVSVTGDGQMWHIETWKDPQTGKTVPGEYYSERWQFSGGGENMIWMPSADMIWKLENDPTISLSSIASTITTTVTMKDGTQKISVVDVTVDDDGMVYFTARSETTV
ncbi:MAG: hypothetical protein IJW14_02695 [Oscillospiraceae bacterium]|nr:hypothetical protein [Oscillospiraceae bacterium]